MYKIILGTIYPITIILSDLMSGCTDFYPEVVVINKVGPSFMIKDISAGGCIYKGVITFENSTSPMPCLPGETKIIFKRIDVQKYCRTQTEYGNISELCLCDGGTPYADTDIVSPEPLWYNYITTNSYRLEPNQKYILELTQENTEQDFSVPGPYGH